MAERHACFRCAAAETYSRVAGKLYRQDCLPLGEILRRAGLTGRIDLMNIDVEHQVGAAHTQLLCSYLLLVLPFWMVH